jgi:uncharacterized protein YdiU (UPF0061 family)
MSHLGFKFENTYSSLPESFYTKIDPVAVSKPKLIMLNTNLADEIGLDFSKLNDKELANMFTGNSLPKGTEPLAQAYAGHQFGHFTMLGDGRAIVWGEHITPNGQRLDIQFKGSGVTPYSRKGDGRAALGPMLREYIISEAMNALKIPTTRSLAVVMTGEEVLRQEGLLPGAILTRVAHSHIRVGTFEYAAAFTDREKLEQLLNYTVERHFSHLIDADNKALELLKEVVERQAELITNWMRVGFIHGVMNTDNMTLSGKTIDYGPCAFMDNYNPMTVFSSIDTMGRYAYANQPRIAQWNLLCLSETLLPLIHNEPSKAIEIANEAIYNFSSIYEEKWLCMMRAKLGLLDIQNSDEDLIIELLKWMHSNDTDYTNTFRALSTLDTPQDPLYSKSTSFMKWFDKWQKRIANPEQSKTIMQATNPVVIPRNHKVEQALNAATEMNLEPIYDLLEALNEPYIDKESLDSFKSPPKPGEQVCQTFCGT